MYLERQIEVQLQVHKIRCSALQIGNQQCQQAVRHLFPEIIPTNEETGLIWVRNKRAKHSTNQ
jgi:hypothetical protein